MDEATKIEVGSGVVLKAGGDTTMTVIEIEDSGGSPWATCVWQVKGEHRQQAYPVAALELVKPFDVDDMLNG